MNGLWPTVLTAIGLILTVLIGTGVTYGITAFQKWTGIQLSAEQRALIQQAADAIANALKLMLAQKKLSALDLNPSNDNVLAVARTYITADVMAALKGRDQTTFDLTRQAVAKAAADHHTLLLIYNEACRVVTPPLTKPAVFPAAAVLTDAVSTKTIGERT